MRIVLKFRTSSRHSSRWSTWTLTTWFSRRSRTCGTYSTSSTRRKLWPWRPTASTTSACITRRAACPIRACTASTRASYSWIWRACVSSSLSRKRSNTSTSSDTTSAPSTRRRSTQCFTFTRVKHYVWMWIIANETNSKCIFRSCLDKLFPLDCQWNVHDRLVWKIIKKNNFPISAMFCVCNKKAVSSWLQVQERQEERHQDHARTWRSVQHNQAHALLFDLQVFRGCKRTIFLFCRNSKVIA